MWSICPVPPGQLLSPRTRLLPSWFLLWPPGYSVLCQKQLITSLLAVSIQALPCWILPTSSWCVNMEMLDTLLELGEDWSIFSTPALSCSMTESDAFLFKSSTMHALPKLVMGCYASTGISPPPTLKVMLSFLSLFWMEKLQDFAVLIFFIARDRTFGSFWELTYIKISGAGSSHHLYGCLGLAFSGPTCSSLLGSLSSLLFRWLLK